MTPGASQPATVPTSCSPTTGTAGSLAIPSGSWRRALTPQQVTDVEQVAGLDLRRVGYGP